MSATMRGARANATASVAGIAMMPHLRYDASSTMDDLSKVAKCDEGTNEEMEDVARVFLHCGVLDGMEDIDDVLAVARALPALRESCWATLESKFGLSESVHARLSSNDEELAHAIFCRACADGLLSLAQWIAKHHNVIEHDTRDRHRHEPSPLNSRVKMDTRKSRDGQQSGCCESQRGKRR